MKHILKPAAESIKNDVVTSVFVKNTDQELMDLLDVSFLDDDELYRFGKIQSPGSRTRFLAGRWLCKTILGAVLRQKNIPLKLARSGKVYCALQNAPLFSLSHSGDWVGISVRSNFEVGMDIEQVRYDRNVATIAERYFHRNENRYVHEQGYSGFYDIWTRKEAWAKLTGKGLQHVLSREDVFAIEATGKITFIHYSIEPDYRCCVASGESPRVHQAWRLDFREGLIPILERPSFPSGM